MIRVTVELLSAVHPSRNATWVAEITNDGRGGEGVGSYNVTFSQRNRPATVWKQVRVTDFPRQTLGAWDLLYRALRECVGSRNP